MFNFYEESGALLVAIHLVHIDMVSTIPSSIIYYRFSAICERFR